MAVVRLGQDVCQPRWSQYTHGGLALLLVDADGAPYAKASVNLAEQVVGVTIELDEMIVKTHSENAGMLESLVASGLVEDTGKRIMTQWAEFPIVRVLDPRGLALTQI